LRPLSPLTHIPCLCKIDRVKRFFLLPFILLFLMSLPRLGFAERPFLETETAIPTDRGLYRLESGLVFQRIAVNQKQSTFNLGLRYGLIHNLEFNLNLPYLFVSDNGNSKNRPGDLLLKTKIRFLKGRAANPLSVAGQMVLKFPTAGESDFYHTTGVVDLGFIAIASKTFSPLTAHINLGYYFIGNPPGQDLPDQVRYALGLSLEMPDTPLKIIGELFGRSGIGSGTSGDPMTAMSGFSIQPLRGLIIDISAGFGLTKDAPDYLISAGISYLLN